MKMFAMILMGLVFSFEVSALQNNQIVLQSFQQPQLQESIPVGNSENVKMASWTKTNASFGMVGQVETVRQDELLTEILIYALIVIVYSLIWNKSNKPVE
jgi:ABC-type lipoprotein release transport system permease subunit